MHSYHHPPYLDFGAKRVTRDNSLSEDAHFAIEISIANTTNTSKTEPRQILFTGVADGVGSWREYGDNPRKFSRRLIPSGNSVSVILQDYGVLVVTVHPGGVGDKAGSRRDDLIVGFVLLQVQFLAAAICSD